MDKIIAKLQQKRHSLKWGFLFYLPIFLIIAYYGTFLIGIATNDLQFWYRENYNDVVLRTDIRYEIMIDENNHGKLIAIPYSYEENSYQYAVTYWIICNTQFILIPAWVMFCIAVPSLLFYNCELKKPIRILLESSQKIANNQLNFRIEYKNPNELGMLCNAFEEMRLALYENNQILWNSMEERKKLNSAFSHDLRTPLTVLKGYADFLEKYIPDGKISEEKLLSVIGMMHSQITRLEHYTQKMNAVQKLEDIIPDNRQVRTEKLFAMLQETGKLLCQEKLQINFNFDKKIIFLDTALVMQVYENMISNALRYAKNEIKINYCISENRLKIIVSDDGDGFSEKGLKQALQPFFRDDDIQEKNHFGLGLYICKILCEKCGGNFWVENDEHGAKVTAEFFCGEIFK
ncbi:MAG: HAMP domain-containing histidine kinase [Ruminococcus sp.]|nr:HAMP domain-containing histidine kinase [Ruminococcus sp.]